MRSTLVTLVTVIATSAGFLPPARGAEPPAAYDIVVYGGTAGGVAAAVEARRLGKTDGHVIADAIQLREVRPEP